MKPKTKTALGGQEQLEASIARRGLTATVSPKPPGLEPWYFRSVLIEAYEIATQHKESTLASSLELVEMHWWVWLEKYIGSRLASDIVFPHDPWRLRSRTAQWYRYSIIALQPQPSAI